MKIEQQEKLVHSFDIYGDFVGAEPYGNGHYGGESHDNAPTQVVFAFFLVASD